MINLRSFTELASKTNSVLLFHSATGKDSIALMELLTNQNIKVQPVFMYVVKGLQQVQNYIAWAEKKYNVTFIQVPHYVTSTYLRTGFMGIKKDPSQRKYSLSDISKMVSINTGIEWSVYGFKKQDGLNRRIMLNELNDQFHIYDPTKKAYPLADWKNSEVLAYINHKKLITPIKNSNGPSSDIEIDNIYYLTWCKENYPEDLKLIFRQYPECEIILHQYEDQAKRNTDDQTQPD
jgi:3'-phosphoadenosine 5'-phosphosulfate sulfotransferase (PAPS reductase)/FAD synthetase